MRPLLKCLACDELREIRDRRVVCTCGRSSATPDDTVIELQGPARVLVPAEDVVTVDGLPWTTMPESPMVIRTASPTALR